MQRWRMIVIQQSFSHISDEVFFGVISSAQRNIYLPTGALDGYVRDPFEFLISPSHLTGVYPTRYRYPSNFHFLQLRLVRFFVSPSFCGFLFGIIGSYYVHDSMLFDGKFDDDVSSNMLCDNVNAGTDQNDQINRKPIITKLRNACAEALR
jgi:hypothetical protein